MKSLLYLHSNTLKGYIYFCPKNLSTETQFTNFVSIENQGMRAIAKHLLVRASEHPSLKRKWEKDVPHYSSV